MGTIAVAIQTQGFALDYFYCIEKNRRMRKCQSCWRRLPRVWKRNTKQVQNVWRMPFDITGTPAKGFLVSYPEHLRLVFVAGNNIDRSTKFGAYVPGNTRVYETNLLQDSAGR